MLCEMIGGNLTTLSSIGIIGGADGPTAIFVTTSTGGNLIAGMIVGAAIVLTALVVLYLIHKK